MQVRLSKNQKIKITSPEVAFSILRPILMRQNEVRRRQEYLWCIGLSARQDIDYIELVAIGGRNVVAVQPVELFSFAVSKRCSSVILAHNHPSGKAKPSLSDTRFSTRMRKAADLLGIAVIDHLVITEDSFYSFAKRGRIPTDPAY